MGKVRRRKPRRRRVGRVSIYLHHGWWWAYYREHGRPVRRAVADNQATAELVAAQINLELAASTPTLFSFRPVSVFDLRRNFIDYHEHFVRSSLATVCRYRTATQHLANFCSRPGCRPLPAHDIDIEAFVRYLRSLRVAPNGHPHTRRRPLRDKGISFILQTCRSMYAYAAKRWHLPPYTENPFAGLGGSRSRVEDAKPLFVFDEQTELIFLELADPWSFNVHCLLAKTGLRVGETIRLLIEDVDFDGRWLHVRNRPELGARTKTRRERAVPLIDEMLELLRRIIGERQAGPIILRPKADVANLPLGGTGSRALVAAVEQRIAATEIAGTTLLDRRAVARISRSVWRDAGATSPDRIRASFIRIAARAGLENASNVLRSCFPLQIRLSCSF